MTVPLSGKPVTSTIPARFKLIDIFNSLAHLRTHAEQERQATRFACHSNQRRGQADVLSVAPRQQPAKTLRKKCRLGMAKSRDSGTWSPNTVTLPAFFSCSPHQEIIEHLFHVVSRVGNGSSTVVLPLAKRPASSNAPLTCALATDGR